MKNMSTTHHAAHDRLKRWSFGFLWFLFLTGTIYLTFLIVPTY